MLSGASRLVALGALALVALPAAWAAQTAQALPVSKIYGVNIGGWLVSEPWLNPVEWLAMGGENCNTCTTCRGSEGALSLSLGQKATDVVFQQHWNSWFTDADIARIKAAGLNTVRIPLGYWLIEALVDRNSTTEPPYARGGLAVLKSRLRTLKAQGINVILDHHAVPGVGHVKQQFAGQCVEANAVGFYTNYNYERALVWAGLMTALIHLDADFEKVFSLQAINEPIQDAVSTPGLGQYYTDFVQTVRVVEKAVGVFFTGSKLPTGVKSSLTVSQTILALADKTPGMGSNARAALKRVQPLLLQLAATYSFRITKVGTKRKQLFTNFEDGLWQRSSQASVQAPNPYTSADGPATYDDHLYYSFGYVANASRTAYLNHICTLARPAAATLLKNTPLWFGEWSLATQWDFPESVVQWKSNEASPASDAFLKEWADAQKWAMATKSSGWIFWNFKVEEGNPYKRNWDYFEALRLGYFTKNPAALNNAKVCAAFGGK